MQKRIVIIAHNIRSAYNVGAIFRTADGFGADKIYLTGYTSTPHDGKKILQTSAQKMISKTALGAEKSLLWEKRENIFEIMDMLRKDGFEIVALEQNKKSIDYRKYVPLQSIVLIVGNEPTGIEPEVIDKCDAVIEIPMRGTKNSLNVAVASGIAGYCLCDKIRK